MFEQIGEKSLSCHRRVNENRFYLSAYDQTVTFPAGRRAGLPYNWQVFVARVCIRSIWSLRQMIEQVMNCRLSVFLFCQFSTIYIYRQFPKTLWPFLARRSFTFIIKKNTFYLYRNTCVKNVNMTKLMLFFFARICDTVQYWRIE